MIFSDPYDARAATLVSGGYELSRAVLPKAGEWITAKTYSRTQVDFRISGTTHLQRAAVLNWWSFLGQTRVSPNLTSTVAGKAVNLDFELSLDEPERTGTVMQIETPGAEGSVAR